MVNINATAPLPGQITWRASRHPGSYIHGPRTGEVRARGMGEEELTARLVALVGYSS